MDMDISMDIHGKSADMDKDMDGKFHIHGKPVNLFQCLLRSPWRRKKITFTVFGNKYSKNQCSNKISHGRQTAREGISPSILTSFSR